MKRLTERLEQLESEVRELKSLVTGIDARTGGGPPREAMQLLTEFRSLLEEARAMLREGDDEADDVLILWGLVTRQQVKSHLTAQSALLDDDHRPVTQIADALCSEQRLSLLVQLIGGEQSSRELSEAAELSGGPLYHHLRNLMASGLVTQPDRSRYRITDRGRDAFLTMAALCRRHRELT